MQSVCAVLYCHLWLVWLYHIFPHYLINGTTFEKKIIEHKIYILIFSTNFVWNITHTKKTSARYYHKYTYVSMQRTRYSCQILMTLEFSRQILEKHSKYQISWKIRPAGAELFHADGQTDMTKLIVAFRNFANAPKNYQPQQRLSYFGRLLPRFTKIL
jgi:hypothetical protein